MVRHSSGGVQYTKTRLPVECVAAFAFKDKHKAFAFEKYLKTGSGRAFMNRHLI
jgi:predicted GIY-YIG superfamily endonuclease